MIAKYRISGIKYRMQAFGQRKIVKNGHDIAGWGGFICSAMAPVRDFLVRIGGSVFSKTFTGVNFDGYFKLIRTIQYILRMGQR